jgi:hypothetical protein
MNYIKSIQPSSDKKSAIVAIKEGGGGSLAKSLSTTTLKSKKGNKQNLLKSQSTHNIQTIVAVENGGGASASSTQIPVAPYCIGTYNMSWANEFLPLQKLFKNKDSVTIAEIKNFVDLYGREYKPIDIKEKGLNDYCFSIVIENLNYSNGYSEKISDCFATGTIPIYWGSPDIGEVFNTDGMIIYDDNFDINSLSFELYESKMLAIIDNFNKSVNFPIAEDYIYKTYIEGK